MSDTRRDSRSRASSARAPWCISAHCESQKYRTWLAIIKRGIVQILVFQGTIRIDYPKSKLVRHTDFYLTRFFHH